MRHIGDIDTNFLQLRSFDENMITFSVGTSKDTIL